MLEPVDLIENAEIVLPDRVQRGWVRLEDGRIDAIGEGDVPRAVLPAAGEGRRVDLRGAVLRPGLVELHRGHLETHYIPRPKVRWHPLGAVLAYDAQIAASGITTVFDSLRAGSDIDGGGLGGELFELAEAIDAARQDDLLRAEHRTHLRCEIPAPDVVEMVERFCERYPVDLLSLMDHTPGQRQFRDLEKYFVYARRSGKSTEELKALTALRMETGAERAARNRPPLVALARRHGIALASHDDTTLADVAQSVEERVGIAEFPTTHEAAAESHARGVRVMMGAPNLVRGGSQSGTVAAAELARHGLLDILSSDYVPGSLLLAAFDLPERVPGITLPQAIATVTANPARATGLDDRGVIAPGQRADLVHVTLAGGVPVVRQVWRQGRRVA